MAVKIKSTPRYWRIRVRPEPRRADQWAVLSIGEGIQLGRYRRGRTWTTQYVLLPKKRFTRAEALRWVREHPDVRRPPRKTRVKRGKPRRRRRKVTPLTLFG